MSSNTENEILLWDKFLEGDRKAFSELFNCFSNRLFRYGSKFINDRETVKDCIQDLFIKLHQNHANLSHTDNPQLYLFKSLKRRILDTIQATEDTIRMDPDDFHFSIHYYYDPEEEKDNTSSMNEKFKKVMDLLTDRQKEAIYLRYQTGMTYEEISELLNITIQSARNLIHRAINKVKSEMDFMAFILIFLKLAN